MSSKTSIGWRLGMVVLAVALAGLLLVAAVLSGQGGAWWSLLGGLVALLALATVLVRLAGSAGSPRLVYTLVPIAAGLTCLTITVGASWFPGELLWWLPGAVLSALPLLAFGVVTADRRRPGSPPRHPS